MKNIISKIKGLNNKNKILIIIGIVLVLGISIFIILNSNNIFKKSVALDEDKLIVEKIKIDDFNEITVLDSRIEKLGKLSDIYVKVKNNTGSNIDKSNLKLTIYDKDNNLLLTSYINEFNNFNVGDEREFQVSTISDISNASKYIVERVK